MKKMPIVYLLGICALLFNGCAFKRLNSDLREFEQLKRISGVVINEAAHPKPVVVVLWALDEDSFHSYWVVHQDGAFSFVRPSGRYYLFAFEDANEDSQYQPDEYAAAYGNPTVINLDSDESFEDFELRLLPPGGVKIPESVDGASAEERQEKFAWRKGQTGLVTTMDNPEFTMENAQMGLWQPLSFVKEIGMKIYFLEPYDPAKIPVLLVHGSNGHPGIWADVVESMDRERYQPWLAFYPSGFRLDMLGLMLSKYLNELHLKYKFDDLIVVAHSMGGLVSRSMIQQYANQESRCKIPLYVTIATPWDGHAGATAGVKHAPAIIPAWYDMVPNSPFIRGLFEKPLPKEMSYYLFFAHKGKGGPQFSSQNTDGTVSLSSQLFLSAQDEAARVFGFDATHVGILSDTNMLNRLNCVLSEGAESN